MLQKSVYFFIAKIAQENILPIFSCKKIERLSHQKGTFRRKAFAQVIHYVTPRSYVSYTYKWHRKPLEGNLIEPQIDFELMKNAALDTFTSTYTLSSQMLWENN